MTRSALYQAPFSVGGPYAIDAELARKLLALALGQGADYADLFFEYRAAGSLVFDEGILKSASRGVSMGLGVRALKGDAAGYAYVERLDWDAMKPAAETAAQIASGGGDKRIAPQAVVERMVPLGVMIFAGTGIAGILTGVNFLDYSRLGHDSPHGHEYGIFAVEIGVLVTVSSTMVAIFYAFVERGR